MQITQRSHRTAAIHTDSRITLESIANQRNHQSLVETTRMEIRTLEKDEWILHCTRVKAHENNPGNELADLLAKEAACYSSLQITYHKYPKTAVTSELKGLGILKWLSEWDNINNGAYLKPYFPLKK